MDIVKSANDVEKIAKIFNTHKKIHGHISLAPVLTSQDLIGLIRNTEKSPYFSELCELIAYHANANDIVYQELFKQSNNDIQILNGIATSKKCPKEILEKLKNFPMRSVSEHAQINLITKSIKTKTEQELQNILDSYNNDSPIDIGVRSVIAFSPDIPETILRRLVDDEIDAIANQARRKLNQ